MKKAELFRVIKLLVLFLVVVALYKLFRQTALGEWLTSLLSPVSTAFAETPGGVDAGCGCCEGSVGAAGSGAPGCSCGGGGEGGGCFKQDALVLTAIDGAKADYKKITELKIGDEIIGAVFDEGGRPQAVKSKILKILAHGPELYEFSELTTNNGARVTATNNHRFITNSKNGGTALEKLGRGHELVAAFSPPTMDGFLARRGLPNEVAAVFNLETETENYFVSQDGMGAVLVHNGGGK